MIQGNTRMEKVQVNFMACISTKIKGWKWPEKKESTTQLKSSVLCNISENVSSGKMKRVFCLLELDVEKENIYMES